MKTYIKRMENSDFDKVTGTFVPHIATSRFGYTEIIPQSNRAFTWNEQNSMQEQEFLHDSKIHLKQEIKDLKNENSKLKSKLLSLEKQIIERSEETDAYNTIYSYSPNSPYIPQSHSTIEDIEEAKEILAAIGKTKKQIEASNSSDEIIFLRREVKDLKSSVGHATNEVINTSLELQKIRADLKLVIQKPEYRIFFEQKEKIQELKQKIREAIELHRNLKLRFNKEMLSEAEYSDSEDFEYKNNQELDGYYINDDSNYLGIEYFSTDICAPNEIVVNVLGTETEDDIRSKYDQYGIITDVIISNCKAIIVFDSEQSALNASCMG